MFRFTAGQPFSTQLLCKSLVERLNETHKSKASQDDIHILAKELVDKPLPQMTYFWDRLNHEQRTALSLMSGELEKPEDIAAVHNILNSAKKRQIELDIQTSELELILDEFYVDGILERERIGEGQYGYRFRADLMRLWIRKNYLEKPTIDLQE
ncbi:hypothetical protein FJZ33_05085 [Candidatus Poribacteria bacterium]|nr:hypothetical protein [Candidatus Poribacteria bacterium]